MIAGRITVPSSHPFESARNQNPGCMLTLFGKISTSLLYGNQKSLLSFARIYPLVSGMLAATRQTHKLPGVTSKLLSLPQPTKQLAAWKDDIKIGSMRVAPPLATLSTKNEEPARPGTAIKLRKPKRRLSARSRPEYNAWWSNKAKEIQSYADQHRKTLDEWPSLCCSSTTGNSPNEVKQGFWSGQHPGRTYSAWWKLLGYIFSSLPSGSSGKFPMICETIVTIFKKGDRSACGNYRGISLISITGKIFARILLNWLSFVQHVQGLHDGIKVWLSFISHARHVYVSFVSHQTGVKQGCVLAPTLFSLYLAAVLLHQVNPSFQHLGAGLRYRVDGCLFNLKRLKTRSKTSAVTISKLQYADDNCAPEPSPIDLQK